jgi:serine/threonine protein kinase
VVYRAVEVSLGREVALKVLLAGERATPEQATRFLREARSAANLSHPNIVPVFSAGTEKGVPYFAMEFIEGTSLEDLSNEPLEILEAVEIARDVAQALHYSHQQNIIHRDIKPANILLDPKGVPKITDFGLAKVLGDQTGLTQEGTALGTPAYMSPEQAAGKTDRIGPHSDLYSLGTVLYELLASRPPFLAESPLHLMAMVQSEDPPSLMRLRSDVPRDVQTICFKALEKEPEQRYPDMGAFADDLDRFLQGEAIRAKPPSFATGLMRWASRQKAALMAGSVTFLLAGGAALLFFLLQKDGEIPPTPPPNPLKPAVSAEGRRAASLKMDIARNCVQKAEKSLLTQNPDNRRTLLVEALKAYEEACRLDPERPEAFLEFGETLAHLERYAEAMEAFDRAIQLNPTLTDAYYGRVQIHYKRYFQSRLLGGQNASVHLRTLIEKDLEQIEKIGAKPEKFHCGRAVLLILDGEDEKALAELDKAIAANESFADAYAARGTIWFSRGLGASDRTKRVLLRKALKEFTNASRLSGGSTEHRSRRAQVLLALGRHREALREADMVVAALPDKPFSYLLRAQVHRAKGNNAGYEMDMDKADTLPCENPDMHFAVAGFLIGNAIRAGGWKKLKPKDVQRALKHLDAVLKQYPERTDIRGIRGMALMLAGRRVEAVHDLEIYVNDFPDSKLAPLARIYIALLKTGTDFSIGGFLDTFRNASEASRGGKTKEAEALFREMIERFETLEKGEGRAAADPVRPILATARVELARLLVRKAGHPDTPSAEKEGLTAEALRLLTQAVDQGFDDFKAFDGDDFIPIRELPAFQKLIRKGKK